MKPTYYTVLEGMWSPRDKAYGWRVFGEYPDKKEAYKAARPIQAVRIIKCVVEVDQRPKDHT